MLHGAQTSAQTRAQRGYALENALHFALTELSATQLCIGDNVRVLREQDVRRALGDEISACDHVVVGDEGVIVIQDKWRERVDLSHVKAFASDALVVAESLELPLKRAVFASKRPLSRQAKTVLQEAGDVFCNVYATPHRVAEPCIATLVAEIVSCLTAPRTRRGVVEPRAASRSRVRWDSFMRAVDLEEYRYTPSSSKTTEDTCATHVSSRQLETE